MGPLQGKYVLTPRDMQYLSTHTSMSKEDIQTRFEQFCVQHPDGKIPKDDFKSTLQTCYSGCDIKKIDEYMYRMYDKDRDGFIDFKEFTVCLYMLSSGSPEEKLRQIFKVFDINNDGVISQLEMTKLVREMYNLIDRPSHVNPISFAKQIFNEMDTDHDGEVSEEDFISACLNDEKYSSLLAGKLLDAMTLS